MKTILNEQKKKITKRFICGFYSKRYQDCHLLLTSKHSRPNGVSGSFSFFLCKKRSDVFQIEKTPNLD